MRIIIKCPESDSPVRGRIHLRRLSLRPTSSLLQSGGGLYSIIGISANYPRMRLIRPKIVRRLPVSCNLLRSVHKKDISCLNPAGALAFL